MSKNTSTSKFRKVDVDEYDEDKYHEEDETQLANAGDVSSRQSAVRAALIANDKVTALLEALKNPPLYASKKTTDASIKNVQAQNANTVLEVLQAFKPAEIQQATKELNEDQSDILMKYLYRWMQHTEDTFASNLLAWHKHLTAHAGLGCIVRVMSDRKRV